MRLGRLSSRLGLVSALAAIALTGCGSGQTRGAADKAGGGWSPPTTLRLAYVGWATNGEDATLLSWFANRVSKLSGGALRVRISDTEYGAPDEEQRIARGVRDHRFDLGWIATGGWDALGVKSFRALQAPFLITDYRLMDAVVRSRLASRMLRGLDRFGVVGLALVPNTLLHPAGPRAFIAPSSYRGVRFLVTRWRTTDELLSALGARPVYTVPPGGPGGLHPLLDANKTGSYTLTGNVVLYARLNTLFANPAALARLSDEERAVLNRAAGELVADAIAETPSEQSAVRGECAWGAITMAPRKDLAALARATRPLTAELERGPQTKAFISEIRKLKVSTPRDPSLVIPSGCEPRGHAARRPPRVLNGSYRYTLSRRAAVAFGQAALRGRDYPIVVTWTLRDGTWTSRGAVNDTGRYRITRDRIAFDWPTVGYTNTFTFTRDADGTLHLKPVPPMDRGDQFVWAAEPWRRIGAQ
jgi:TRAP-type C4-dicarboxylate transport system substrate-binding protein